MAVIPHITTAAWAGLTVVTWSSIAAGDTTAPFPTENGGPLGGAVQFSGTFGGAVTLEGSVDGVNYHTLKDVSGAAISATTAGIYEFSTGCVFLRASPAALVAGVTVTIALRG